MGSSCKGQVSRSGIGVHFREQIPIFHFSTWVHGPRKPITVSNRSLISCTKRGIVVALSVLGRKERPLHQRIKEVMIMAKVQKATDSSSLAEVVDRILDKGIVVDAWVKVSLVGIELLSIEARVVIASVETYLKYAEAIGLTATAAAPAA
jgi:hypothetical protein